MLKTYFSEYLIKPLNPNREIFDLINRFSDICVIRNFSEEFQIFLTIVLVFVSQFYCFLVKFSHYANPLKIRLSFACQQLIPFRP